MGIRLIDRMKAVGIIYREPVKLSGGQDSEYYVDVKKAYGDPEILNELADTMQLRIGPEANVIACSGHGGIPLAAVMMSRHGYRLALIRDAPKGHGKGGIFDGYVPTEDDSIAIVDDVWTTGGSIRGNEKKKGMLYYLKPTGADIVSANVVVKRGPGDLSDLGIKTRYLFAVDEFL